MITMNVMIAAASLSSKNLEVLAFHCTTYGHCLTSCLFMLPCFDLIFANTLCFFDLSSAKNHNMTTGIPITKKTIIVLIGTRITKREMAKHTVPIPIINNQRRMMSMSPDST